MSVKPSSTSALFNSLENSFLNQLPNAPDSFVIVTGSASSGKSILISSLQSTTGSSNLSTPP
jgi:Tfp pilus assembly pilus retraction ATPase PilT